MMEKEYYIVVNDNREGPFTLAQLSERGIEPSTLVWTAGMADWTRADSMPELEPLLANRNSIDNNESAFGAYAAPQEPLRQPYRQPQQNAPFNNGANPMGSYSNPSTNWKTLAILATIFGFFFSCVGGFVGISAWVNANKAENAMKYGDEFTARSAWSTCKTLCIVSFVLIGIGLIFNVLTYLKVFSVNQFLLWNQ